MDKTGTPGASQNEPERRQKEAEHGVGSGINHSMDETPLIPTSIGESGRVDQPAIEDRLVAHLIQDMVRTEVGTSSQPERFRTSPILDSQTEATSESTTSQTIQDLSSRAQQEEGQLTGPAIEEGRPDAGLRDNRGLETTMDIPFSEDAISLTPQIEAEPSTHGEGASRSQHRSLSSTEIDTYNPPPLEGVSRRRSASASTSALSPVTSTHSTEVETRGPQHPSTVVPIPGEPSPPRPSRNDGDIVLPRWQPDAEVTYCPICRTQFSFFVRKHHCRKCGRVVCNSCSPHRITIPYQFIVQPPPVVSVASSQSQQVVDSRDHDSSILADRHGGMKVRLCNPCVPDPNTIPPQQPTNEIWRDAPQPTYFVDSGDRPYSFGEEAMNNLERSSNSFTRDGSIRPRGLSAASGLAPPDRRQQQYSGSSYGGRSGVTVHNNFQSNAPQSNSQSLRYSNQTASHSYRPVSYMAQPQPSPNRGHTRGHQSLSHSTPSSTSNPQPHYRSLLDVSNQRISTSNTDTRPLPPTPRIPEEDECPVCHRELPSRTLLNFEDVRAAHIMQCIEDQLSAHSGQARPGAYTSNSQPAPNPSISSSSTSQSQPQPQSLISSVSHPILPQAQDIVSHIVPNQASSSSHASPSRPIVPTPIANTPEARTAAREAAHAAVVLRASQSSSPFGENVRRTGMFLYKASEKDCVDDAECTICLEEFEVGVGMARLECLCRFHARCIRDWFVDHPGRCPVHQHDGYGF